MTQQNPKVTLLDGREVDSWSPEWRAECLKRNEHVQMIFGMLGSENRHIREKYYESIRRNEGPEFEKRVRQAVEKIWKMDKARMKESK